MPSKVVRLDEEAIDLYLKYGKTVSEGIRSCISDEPEVLARGY